MRKLPHWKPLSGRTSNMTRTDHIRHAFSPRQMEILRQLAIDEMCRKNKQGELPDDELNYAS